MSGMTRREVAATVYGIVARFALSIEEYGAGSDGLDDQVEGMTTEEMEQGVRDLWEKAEGRTLRWHLQDDQIVSVALYQAAVYDDYRRIRRGVQWMAFEP